MSYSGPVAPADPIELRIRATQLAKWRRTRGLTQRELAQRLAVSQNYIPSLESGSRDPGPNLRGLLMERLGVEFFDLFDVVLVGVDGEELHLQPVPTPHAALPRARADRVPGHPAVTGSAASPGMHMSLQPIPTAVQLVTPVSIEGDPPSG